ncbi:hypothetical protein WJX84_009944 [Apatococcus fuscideae]|uniref:Uncharacterized protein n=1 Tax=Apatococcus fuscideae TaxID=2026836 RepID=A0AAW1TJD7_9CHLO
MSWTSFTSSSQSPLTESRQTAAAQAVPTAYQVQSPGTSSFAHAACEAARQDEQDHPCLPDPGHFPAAAEQGQAALPGMDSAHAAMLKQQAESLSAVSLAEDNVSNVALLHLELKVARKKLEQQDDRMLDTEAVISGLHQQMAASQEAQAKAQSLAASLQAAASQHSEAASQKLKEAYQRLAGLEAQHAASMKAQQQEHAQVVSEMKAAHASATHAKVEELARQLTEAKSAKAGAEERLSAQIDELSAKLASEKRRTAALKVQLDADKENEHYLQNVRHQSEQGLQTSLQRLQKDAEFNQKKATALQQHLQEGEAAKTSQELKLQQAERSLKSLQTTLAGLQGSWLPGNTPSKPTSRIQNNSTLPRARRKLNSRRTSCPGLRELRAALTQATQAHSVDSQALQKTREELASKEVSHRSNQAALQQELSLQKAELHDGQLAQARSMAQKAAADSAQQRSAAQAAADAMAEAACADLKRQVAALRQQLKICNHKLQTAETKYATHAGSMAALQSRSELAEQSAKNTQASLKSLQESHSVMASQHTQELHAKDSLLQGRLQIVAR